MSRFKDLSELVTDGPHLDLPIRGKTYRIDDVDGETALWLTDIMSLAERAHAGEDVGDAAELSDADERELFDRVLGRTVHAQMLADGVRSQELKHVLMTAWTWIKTGDEDSAVRVWEALAKGEAPSPAGNRHSRRASEAAARTTPRPASTSGTTASRKKGSGRRGKNSSRSGR